MVHLNAGRAAAAAAAEAISGSQLSEHRRDDRIPRSLSSLAVIRTGLALGGVFQAPASQAAGEIGFDNVATVSRHPQKGIELQVPAMRGVGQGKHGTALA